MTIRNHRGAAIIAVVLASALLSALALSVTIVMTTETQASAHHGASREALYAADGAIAIAAQSLLLYADWNDVIAGGALAPFNDGPPSGTRRLADGTMLSLPGATGAANAMPRPWGPNNPQWTLFGFGWLGASMYVVAWVADDPLENDGDPARDGSDPATNPGAGIVAIRAEAFGPSAAHKVLEATARRIVNGSGEAAVQMLSWHEIR